MATSQTGAAVRAQLQMDINDVARRVSAGVFAKPQPDREPEPFGRWLLAQHDRGDWIDDLAGAARRDPGFPKSGDPDDVRGHLAKKGVTDPDVFEQVDDAERHWMTL